MVYLDASGRIRHSRWDAWGLPGRMVRFGVQTVGAAHAAVPIILGEIGEATQEIVQHPR